MISHSSLVQSTTGADSHLGGVLSLVPFGIIFLIVLLFYLKRMKRFWGSTVLGAPDSSTIVVDITTHARALGILRWTEHFVVINSGTLLAINMLDTIFNNDARELWSELWFPPLMAIFCWAALTCLRYSNDMDPLRWHPLLWVYSILLVLVAIFWTGLAFISVKVADDISIISFLESLSQSDAVKDIIAVLSFSVWTGVSAALGIASMLVLLRRKLSGLSITVRVLTAFLCNLSGDYSRSSVKLKRISPLRGTMYAASAGIIILGTFLLIIVSNSHVNPLGLWFPLSIGYFLALRARLYFQVSADSLLSVDKRSPILFLRSFDDDELQTSRSPSKALLDFSLETRLANHFMRYGPFIAVGDPRERIPNLGATRVLLPDEQWQRTVLNWINEAALIVMYAGKTRWVRWELERIIQTDHVSRLILLIPEIKAWSTAKRDQELAQRAAQLRVVFRHTQWAEQLNSWWDYFNLRAVVFRPDGSLVAIKSGSRSRDSYHLAALVAHYVLDCPTPFTSETEYNEGRNWNESAGAGHRF
jgi:hypothetical protein